MKKIRKVLSFGFALLFTFTTMTSGYAISESQETAYSNELKNLIEEYGLTILSEEEISEVEFMEELTIEEAKEKLDELDKLKEVNDGNLEITYPIINSSTENYIEKETPYSLNRSDRRDYIWDYEQRERYVGYDVIHYADIYYSRSRTQAPLFRIDDVKAQQLVFDGFHPAKVLKEIKYDKPYYRQNRTEVVLSASASIVYVLAVEGLPVGYTVPVRMRGVFTDPRHGEW